MRVCVCVWCAVCVYECVCVHVHCVCVCCVYACARVWRVACVYERMRVYVCAHTCMCVLFPALGSASCAPPTKKGKALSVKTGKKAWLLGCKRMHLHIAGL